MLYRQVRFKAVPELHALIGKDADEKNVSMSELISQLLADHYGRPELGRVPRLRWGRPARYETEEVTS